MPHSDLSSIPGVADVEILKGPDAPADAAPSLLVEVPHGATRRSHYDALRAQLVGELPEGLHAFFHVNTDVGAWSYGRRVAERVLSDRPDRVALLVRCTVPRTFVDCNRVPDAAEGDLAHGGITAAIPSYVQHPADHRLLLDLHRRYVQLVRQAYAAVCDAGGFALSPHTYGTWTMGIERVDEHIVENVRWALSPEQVGRWTVRPPVDLLTRTADGTVLAPAEMEGDLVRRFAEVGLAAEIATSYALHPSTLGCAWATRWPGQTLCLEIRRDLLFPGWPSFTDADALPDEVDRVAAPIAAAIAAWLDARGL